MTHSLFSSLLLWIFFKNYTVTESENAKEEDKEEKDKEEEDKEEENKEEEDQARPDKLVNGKKPAKGNNTILLTWKYNSIINLKMMKQRKKLLNLKMMKQRKMKKPTNQKVRQKLRRKIRRPATEKEKVIKQYFLLENITLLLT